MPAPKAEGGKAALYSLKVDQGKGTVQLTRNLNIDLLILDQKYYPTLRSFFQIVRTGDDEQVVLQPGPATASN